MKYNSLGIHHVYTYIKVTKSSFINYGFKIYRIICVSILFSTYYFILLMNQLFLVILTLCPKSMPLMFYKQSDGQISGYLGYVLCNIACRL